MIIQNLVREYIHQTYYIKHLNTTLSPLLQTFKIMKYYFTHLMMYDKQDWQKIKLAPRGSDRYRIRKHS